MIPLQDTEHADSYPLVTRPLILVTVLVFVLVPELSRMRFVGIPAGSPRGASR